MKKEYKCIICGQSYNVREWESDYGHMWEVTNPCDHLYRRQGLNSSPENVLQDEKSYNDYPGWPWHNGWSRVEPEHKCLVCGHIFDVREWCDSGDTLHWQVDNPCVHLVCTQGMNCKPGSVFLEQRSYNNGPEWPWHNGWPRK